MLSFVWLFSTFPSYLQQQPEYNYCFRNVFPAKGSNELGTKIDTQSKCSEEKNKPLKAYYFEKQPIL